MELPAGFSMFPLTDIDSQMDRALKILAPLSPRAVQGALEDLVEVLRTSLEDMRIGGVLYCGMGWHRLPDSDEEVSSWLTVNVQDFGPARNPQLALEEFLRGIPNGAGESSGGVMTEVVDGRPIAYFDNVADGGAYCQLRAVVPSEDGTRLAVVELSSSAVDHGPRFRGAVVGVARSIRFVEARSDALCW